MGQKQSATVAPEQPQQQQQPPSAEHPLKLAPFNHPIVLQGLAGAGKSSVQQRMQIPEERTLRIDDKFLTSPPIYSVDRSGANYPHWGDKRDDKLWMTGGRMGARAIWTMVLHSTKALVFVVDASDRASLVAPTGADAPAPLPKSFVKNFFMKQPEKQAAILATLKARMTARQVLHSLLAHRQSSDRPILVLANKQDKPGAMPPAELAQLLGLPDIVDRDWRISGCNAETGEGLEEAFAWLNYIIASPTDFTAARARKQDVVSKKWELQYKYEEAQRQMVGRRVKRIDMGMVPLAPLPLPTRKDGSTWTPSEEQRAAFVVSEPTPDPEAQAELAALAEAKAAADEAAAAADFGKSQPASAAAASVAAASTDPVSVAKVVESVVAAPESVEHSAHEQEVSSKARTESSVHSAAGGESELNETLGVQLVDEAVDRNPDAVIAVSVAAVAVDSKPDASKQQLVVDATPFSSLSSSFVVLPPLASIPTLEMRLAKKHWYSKKHLRPVPPVEDIHKHFRNRQVWW